MVSVDYKQDLRRAGISGIAFFIVSFFSSIFFSLFFRFLPLLKIDFSIFSKYYYFFGGLILLLQLFLIYNFYKGYFIIGEKFNLPFLTKISKFLIILFAIFFIFLFFYFPSILNSSNNIILNSQNMTEQQAYSFIYSFLLFFLFVLLFVFIFGILNIFLGREILKLQDQFNTLALISGYSKIILGVAYVSIIFSSLAGIFLLASFVSDILLFFEVSKNDVSSKKVKKAKKSK